MNSQPRPSDEVVVFNPGDKVKVNVDEERLKSLQDGHGGWNPRMVQVSQFFFFSLYFSQKLMTMLFQYIGEIGIVHRVTDKGDVRVQFENCSNRWTFHPAALVKVNRFKVGDSVRILNDVAKVQELQKGHGEWLDIMALVSTTSKSIEATHSKMYHEILFQDIGKVGQVAKIYSDGDLRVNIEDQAWTLNPFCLELVAETEAAPNFSELSDELRSKKY